MSYTASIKKNPNGEAYTIEFRHPSLRDKQGKEGKKVRKGLGVISEQDSNNLVAQLNSLLADKSLHSISAKNKAAQLYDERLIEIFYAEIEAPMYNSELIMDRLLPLPTIEDGYARVALVGVPGAGKTTLIRQLMGTHPKKERYPSTSVNRTTTFPTEIVLMDGFYKAVATLMTERETEFEIQETVAAALIEAVSGKEKEALLTFLEKSDMRFRLKYILGDIEQQIETDPYADDVQEDDLLNDVDSLPQEKQKHRQFVLDCLKRIMEIARQHREKKEEELQTGAMTAMSEEDKTALLDLIQEEAIDSDEFRSLVSDILDVIRTKFNYIENDAKYGSFEKSTTGWPKAWSFEAPNTVDGRAIFLKAVRLFSGIATQSWGYLLTPLVTKMRITGAFKPTWSKNNAARLVLIDTEGLGHKANANANALPEQMLRLFNSVDVILLVDSAQNSMTHFAAGKALETIAHTGHTKKLSVVFTHMDAVKGDGFASLQAKSDHVFAGLKNVIENQIADNISKEASRHILEHLKKSVFFVGKIDLLEPKPAIPELQRLQEYLAKAQPPHFKPVAFPEYNFDRLGFAIQDAAKAFHQQWQGYLKLVSHPDFKPVSWQSLKSLSRRYAENLSYNPSYLNPVADFTSKLSASLSRFLETPIKWSGDPTEEQKRDVIDSVKKSVNKKLSKLSRRRIIEDLQVDWKGAWELRGAGSTYQRHLLMNNIYIKAVPIPDARGDEITDKFLAEIKEFVVKAIAKVQEQIATQEAERQEI